MRTIDIAAQKFQEKGRNLLSWAAPLLVKIWISAAFFLR
jgi:hypothetical protein